MEEKYYPLLIFTLPLILGWIADKILGDPERLPHPVILFGKMIGAAEKRGNKGKRRVCKGAFITIFLISFVFIFFAAADITADYADSLTGKTAFPVIRVLWDSLFVFFGLAGTTLIREVRQIFRSVSVSVEAGRERLSRIVGRDTSSLNAQQIRTAALESLSENLSDGVIAPIFWYLLLGVPGMMAYKMVNTLDSMIGYKNHKYLRFGRWAAGTDDFANYLPARITAILKLLVSGKLNSFYEVKYRSKNHSSPNSGYPEAALAILLKCRFGGPSYYGGKLVYKPYIGAHIRELDGSDVKKGIRINTGTEIAMIFFTVLLGGGIRYIIMLLQ